MFITKKQGRERARQEWRRFLEKKAGRTKILQQLEAFLTSYLEPHGRLLISIAMKNELDYMPALSSFTQSMYAPVTLPHGKMEFRLYMRGGKAIAPPVPGFMNVPGPWPDAELIAEPLTNADIALVPSLAADSTGRRLGRGGGYYDRWKNKLIPARKIALLPESLTNLAFPAEAHDLRLDGVITPMGFKKTINETSNPGDSK